MSSPHGEGRPGEKATHSKNIAAGDFDKSSVIQRRYWAQQLLDAGEGYPVYGSPDWNVLQLDDPRRVASCVHAAEIYTRDWYDDLESRLRTEVEQMRVAHKHAEDLDYLRSFAGRIKRNGGRVLTTFEERRARQIEAAKPRSGDHMGGPVEWDGGGA